eukprot:TRINITY_DN774273_c0_g1_i1.p1 TRINITY_DN774273_c0_g1~~TRINITY_DN774273_c0_g1_i1.p1  ORF type:complete len:366 (+),score=48.42 TRINITY_DN774273_c0_g1_i1:100-1197(+)
MKKSFEMNEPGVYTRMKDDGLQDRLKDARKSVYRAIAIRLVPLLVAITSVLTILFVRRQEISKLTPFRTQVLRITNNTFMMTCFFTSIRHLNCIAKRLLHDELLEYGMLLSFRRNKYFGYRGALLPIVTITAATIFCWSGVKDSHFDGFWIIIVANCIGFIVMWKSNLLRDGKHAVSVHECITNRDGKIDSCRLTKLRHLLDNIDSRSVHEDEMQVIAIGLARGTGFWKNRSIEELPQLFSSLTEDIKTIKKAMTRSEHVNWAIYLLARSSIFKNNESGALQKTGRILLRCQIISILFCTAAMTFIFGGILEKFMNSFSTLGIVLQLCFVVTLYSILCFNVFRRVKSPLPALKLADTSNLHSDIV